jgi:hypothetical protein
MITQSFENSQKPVFGRTLVLVLGMKDSKNCIISMSSKLSDLRALQNHRYFGSTRFRAICAKHSFLQTKDKYILNSLH